MSTARLLPILGALGLLVAACTEPVVAPGASPAPQDPMPTATPIQDSLPSPEPSPQADEPTLAPPPVDDPYYDY